jgi:hypothetical protein
VDAGGLPCANAGTIMTDASKPPMRRFERIEKSPGSRDTRLHERAIKKIVPASVVADDILLRCAAFGDNHPGTHDTSFC